MNESSDQVRVEILQVVLERKVERVTGRECPTFRRPRFDFVFFFCFWFSQKQLASSFVLGLFLSKLKQ